MQIIIYTTNSDKKSLDKKLSILQTLDNVNLLQDCSIIDPVFRFNGLISNYPNYLYCSEFKRYYFVNDIHYLSGQIVEFHCHVDVLMSFKNDILNIDCVINRAGKNFNVLLRDDIKMKQTNSISVNKIFTGGEFLTHGISASNRSFLLSAFGGVME